MIKEPGPSVLISMVHRYGSVFIARALEPLGIGGGQHAYLAALLEEGGLTQEHFCRLFALDKAAVSRAVAILEKKGLILKIQDERDSRYVRIDLTDEGRKTALRVQDILNDWDAALSAGLDSDSRKTLDRLLGIITENARKTMLNY